LIRSPVLSPHDTDELAHQELWLAEVVSVRAGRGPISLTAEGDGNRDTCQPWPSRGC